MSVAFNDGMEQALIEARARKTDPERYKVIARFLAAPIDYATPEGKVLGSRRALFCSRISNEKLWPERAK